VNTYIQEKGLLWINCISICSDGAAAMTGHIKGFRSFTQKENPSLGNRLGEAIKTVLQYYTKTHPLKWRLFEKLCQEMDA
jgi:hypothetical protein